MKTQLLCSLMIMSAIAPLSSCSKNYESTTTGLDIVTPPSIQKTQVDKNTYTLTATITPSDATIKFLDWSISWVNPTSEWANGKTVTDYVTLSAITNVATVKMINRFSEQIEIVATTTDGTNLRATCLVDCYKLVDSLDFSFNKEKLESESNGIATFSNITYGEGIVLEATELIDNQTTYEINLAQIVSAEMTYTEGTLNAINDEGLSLTYEAFPDYNVDGGGILTYKKIIEIRDYSLIINPAIEGLDTLLNHMVTEFGESIIPDVLLTFSRAGVEKSYPIYVHSEINYVSNLALSENAIRFS